MKWLKVILSLLVIALCIWAVLLGYRMIRSFMVSGAGMLSELGNSSMTQIAPEPTQEQNPSVVSSDKWDEMFGEKAFDQAQGVDLMPGTTSPAQVFEDDDDQSEVPVDQLPNELEPYAP